MAENPGTTNGEKALYGARTSDFESESTLFLVSSREGASADAEAPSLHTTVTDILNRMCAVEEVMIHLRDYLAARESEGRPLLEWGKYPEYHVILGAVDALVKTKDNFRGLCDQDQIHISCSLDKARRISTSVSNSAVYAMGTMNHGTADYVEDMEDNFAGASSTINANATHIIASELAKLLKHSTSATNSVWSALDKLQKLDASLASKPSPSSSIQRNREYLQWDWLKWSLLVLVISTFAIVLRSTINPYDPYLEYTQACARSNDVYNWEQDINKAHVTLLRAQGEQLEINKVIFDYKMEALLNQTNVAAEQAQASNDRIDNIWEALGPPNAKGTYYATGGPVTVIDDTQKIKSVIVKMSPKVEKQLKELNEKIEGKVYELKENLEEAKREWRREDARLSNRLDRVPVGNARNEHVNNAKTFG